MASKTGCASVGELLMIPRISAVAACWSRASLKARSSSAQGDDGSLLLGSLKGVPHSSQNFAAARFSCWHRGHVMPQPPSSRGGGRSEPWLKLTAQDSHGQEPGPRGHAWGRRAGWASPSSPVAQPLKWTQLITQAATGLSPETVRRGGERDRCGTALLGGSNPVTTRIVRRVSRKQFAVLDCGSDQHFRHKLASAQQLCVPRRKIPWCSAVAPAGMQSKRPYHWPGDAREVEASSTPCPKF